MKNFSLSQEILETFERPIHENVLFLEPTHHDTVPYTLSIPPTILLNIPTWRKNSCASPSLLGIKCMRITKFQNSTAS